ncbi:hypothetical protein GF369_04345 [Candidatus Peregrinibacteria bacterium]|nr:hypothetical protein [Candidatus Peregrinibacteria bacterium]
MNKHYFSDITDLFLKVKQEENIPIDANAKESIKAMLRKQINEMKDADTYKNLEPLGGKQSFWTTWKRQLIGVPASLVAVMVIVFAMSSLQPSVPKDDFSPRQSEPAPQATEEAVEKHVFDRPLVKTAQKPETKQLENQQEDRSLNKKDRAEATVVSYETPVAKEDNKQEESSLFDDIQYNTGQTFILQTNEDEDVYEETEKQQETQPRQTEEDPEPEPDMDTDVEAETKPDTNTEQDVQTENIVNIAVQESPEPLDSLEADIPPDTVTEIQDVQEPLEPTLDAIDESRATQVKQPALTAYPVYVYKDKNLEESPAFSKEKLAKLTKSYTPDLVSVYYVENNQVVVEIEENDITKWYLFDNIDGTWTISKYEKFITKDVVK